MNSTELSSLYRIRFPAEQLARKNQIWQIICKYFFQKFIPSTSTVVDVACGHGEFVNNIVAEQKIGVDLNLDSKSFLHSNVTFFESDVRKMSEKIAHESVDILFTSNFLEHLPDKKNLSIFLEQVKCVLKPNGKYLILGPNLRYLPGKYWDYYDHHLGLTHLSLIEALQLHGFKIELCIDRFLPFTTQSQLPTHPFFVWLYLKIPFVWKFLGKQFFIIARK